MKKILISILTILGVGLSFCNAQSYYTGGIYNQSTSYTSLLAGSSITNGSIYNCFRVSTTTCRQDSNLSIQNPGDLEPLFLPTLASNYTLVCGLSNGSVIRNYSSSNCQLYFYNIDLGGSCPELELSTIDVLYNNEQSTSTITCNGDNVIQIDGLSTITATNKFTPYFNIDYKDEDNQSLVESYSKDILYLTGALFKKTYTGNNERILSYYGYELNSFSGYLPTFEITGSINDVIDSGNVFNNFAQNSLQVALSNIPSYIQYVIIIMLLFFILGLARRKKRR